MFLFCVFGATSNLLILMENSEVEWTIVIAPLHRSRYGTWIVSRVHPHTALHGTSPVGTLVVLWPLVWLYGFIVLPQIGSCDVMNYKSLEAVYSIEP